MFCVSVLVVIAVIALEMPLLLEVKRSDVVVVMGLAGAASALVVRALAAEVPAMMVVGVVVVDGTPGTSVLTVGCKDASVVCP